MFRFPSQRQQHVRTLNPYLFKSKFECLTHVISRNLKSYLVGTENGHIHKCSCSYNEQYLGTYFSHSGPVNRVKWSPFLTNVFLSCSSDWTVCLWSQDSEEPILRFQSGRDTVSDVAWSPHISTCFATVSSDGRLEIWDLQSSVLDPIINHNVLDRKFTSVLFSSKSPTILTGDDNGSITVYKLCKSVLNEDDTSTAGIIDARASLPSYNESAAVWRAQQAATLQQLISGKNSV